MKKLLLLISHAAALALGFAAGIYVLPILTAPSSPSTAEVNEIVAAAVFSGHFRRDLAGSDALHWGEGRVHIAADHIALEGQLAPGPDYQLYLVPEFVETEAEFQRLKSRSARVGPVKTFDNFMVAVPPGVDVAAYTTVVVWCETFQQFITAGSYR